MARNVIMGKYICSRNHEHSTYDEVVDCNRVEEKRYETDKKAEIEKESIILDQKRQDNASLDKRIKLQELQNEHEKQMAENRSREKKQNSGLCVLL